MTAASSLARRVGRVVALLASFGGVTHNASAADSWKLSFAVPDLMQADAPAVSLEHDLTSSLVVAGSLGYFSWHNRDGGASMLTSAVAVRYLSPWPSFSAGAQLLFRDVDAESSAAVQIDSFQVAAGDFVTTSEEARWSTRLTQLQLIPFAEGELKIADDWMLVGRVGYRAPLWESAKTRADRANNVALEAAGLSRKQEHLVQQRFSRADLLLGLSVRWTL